MNESASFPIPPARVSPHVAVRERVVDTRALLGTAELAYRDMDPVVAAHYALARAITRTKASFRLLENTISSVERSHLHRILETTSRAAAGCPLLSMSARRVGRCLTGTGPHSLHRCRFEPGPLDFDSGRFNWCAPLHVRAGAEQGCARTLHPGDGAACRKDGTGGLAEGSSALSHASPDPRPSRRTCLPIGVDCAGAPTRLTTTISRP